MSDSNKSGSPWSAATNLLSTLTGSDFGTIFAAIAVVASALGLLAFLAELAMAYMEAMEANRSAEFRHLIEMLKHSD